MNAEQLISVIVPVYKVELFLEECVNSIINQTYKNLEIILVDDGSPDKCPQLCEEFAKKDNRIKVIHKQNGGLSDARNFGIDVAKGQWITFVDSDDAIDAKMIQTLFEQIQDKQILVSCCSFYSFTDSLPTDINKSFTQICDFDEICKKKIYITAWAKLYKSELFNNIRFPVGRLHEDEFTTYKLLDISSKIAYTDAPMYFYRQRNGSIMTQIKEKNIIDRADAYLERAKYFYEKQNYKQYIAAIKYLCSDIICNYKQKAITNLLRKQLKTQLCQFDLKKGTIKDKVKIWLSLNMSHLMSLVQQIIWKVKGIKQC